MVVRFGKFQTKGIIRKLNRVRAKVELCERRPIQGSNDHRSEPGAIWTVSYSQMRKVEKHKLNPIPVAPVVPLAEILAKKPRRAIRRRKR